MNWVVTVGNKAGKFLYWVEADNKQDAEARGFRLHGASSNARHDGSDRVAESKEVQ